MTTDQNTRPTADTVRRWMENYVRSNLDLPEDFTTAMRFDGYGIDSVEAVIMAGVMEEDFGIAIEPRFFFDDPSIDGVVCALVNEGLLEP